MINSFNGILTLIKTKFVKDLKMTKTNEELKLLLQFNSIAYSVNKVESIKDIAVATDLQGYELVDATCNYKDLQSNGLKAAVFYNKTTKHTALAVAGTRPDDISDLIDDLKLLSGELTTKIEDLKSFIDKSIKNSKLEIKDISVVGHSLGSVIADLANVELTALEYITDTTLFESPGSNHSVVTANNKELFSKKLSTEQLVQIKPATYNSKPNIINNGNSYTDSNLLLHRGDIFVIPTAKIIKKTKPITLFIQEQEGKKTQAQNKSGNLQYLSVETFKALPEIAGLATKFGINGLNNIYRQLKHAKEHSIGSIYNNLENGSNPYKVEYGYNNKKNGSPSIEILMAPEEFIQLEEYLAQKDRQTSLLSKVREYNGLTTTKQFVIKAISPEEKDLKASEVVVDNQIDISSAEFAEFLFYKSNYQNPTAILKFGCEIDDNYYSAINLNEAKATPEDAEDGYSTADTDSEASFEIESDEEDFSSDLEVGCKIDDNYFAVVKTTAAQENINYTADTDSEASFEIESDEEDFSSDLEVGCKIDDNYFAVVKTTAAQENINYTADTDSEASFEIESDEEDDADSYTSFERLEDNEFLDCVDFEAYPAEEPKPKSSITSLLNNTYNYVESCLFSASANKDFNRDEIFASSEEPEYNAYHNTDTDTKIAGSGSFITDFFTKFF